MECDISFSSTSSRDAGSFRLLELPPELCTLVETAVDNGSSTPCLTIKGNADDDAVLCTADKTYSMRSVVLSNSILVVTVPPTTENGDISESGSRGVVIRDQLQEIIELVPSVPKLHRLNELLKGREYDEDQERFEGGFEDDGHDERPTKRRRFTYEDAQSEIQASSAELARGLREKRILNINNDLQPIQPAYLKNILELLLSYLVSMSIPHNAAPVEALLAALSEEHEIPRPVVRQVMSWFGSIHSDLWSVDVDAVLKEVGLGILREHKDDPISENEFIVKWRASVGDTFEAAVSLSLLSGSYIVAPSLTRELPEQVLSYFPASSLPVEPAARFADLFLTRSRWKEDEISPFLADIAVNSKERDKLLLKFARATTDQQGVWYTARAQSGG